MSVYSPPPKINKKIYNKHLILIRLLSISLTLIFVFVGHNWGSEHDPDTTDCAPPSIKGGHFLMYPYAVMGYETNNKVSLAMNSISDVMVTVVAWTQIPLIVPHPLLMEDIFSCIPML